MHWTSKGTVAVITAIVIGLGLYWVGQGNDRPALDAALPFSDTPYLVEESIDAYNDFMMSGGPPPDGIPSIDDPIFTDADAAPLGPGDKVIGFYHEGEARAYPQNILVHHEIVNDDVGDLPVAITYCPLTATAQGYKRGETTLGVSGQLLNSNLVMFDRETESYFSQILGVGLSGEHSGETLDEVNLIWTTWEKWQDAHPDTEVLTEDTGHMRNYANDPYGDYNPIGGYYQSSNVMFPLMNDSDAAHSKEMVVGARTDDASVHFSMDELADAHVLTTGPFVAVYDPDLDTGYIYRHDDETVTAEGDGTYAVGDEHHAADDLPLDKLVSVEAFHFAWHAFYPSSETV